MNCLLAGRALLVLKRKRIAAVKHFIMEGVNAWHENMQHGLERDSPQGKE